MTQHLFIDESKSAGLLLAAACYSAESLDDARRSLQSLLLPGQERLHFSSERDSRRWRILSAITASIEEVVIVQASSTLLPRQQRERALSGLVEYARQQSAARLCIELDDSVFEFDRRVMFEQCGRHGRRDTLSYAWLRPRQEPLLWAADGIAWSWVRGGPWRSTLVDAVPSTLIAVR